MHNVVNLVIYVCYVSQERSLLKNNGSNVVITVVNLQKQWLSKASLSLIHHIRHKSKIVPIFLKCFPFEILVVGFKEQETF